jgi:glutamate 5-kinase
VNGKQSNVFDLLAQGLCPGTLFDAAPTKRSARHQWLSHTVKSKGTLTLDLGAYMAVTEKGASLLAVGISAISGNFKSNDAVDIAYQGCIVAKGISLYSHTELQSIKGLNSSRIEDVLGFSHGEEAVHRDDLVLIKARIP